MSYIDNLDRRRSVLAARHELSHFSDLYKLHEFDDVYELNMGSCSDSIISMINYLNYDSREINK